MMVRKCLQGPTPLVQLQSMINICSVLILFSPAALALEPT